MRHLVGLMRECEYTPLEVNERRVCLKIHFIASLELEVASEPLTMQLQRGRRWNFAARRTPSGRTSQSSVGRDAERNVQHLHHLLHSHLFAISSLAPLHRRLLSFFCKTWDFKYRINFFYQCNNIVHKIWCTSIKYFFGDGGATKNFRK